MNSDFIKYFITTDGIKFLYHPYFNKLYKISNELIDEVNESLSKRVSEAINYCQSSELNDNSTFPINGFKLDETRKSNNKIKLKVVFCITQKCNFRCKYCLYGGNYSEYGYRKHSNVTMTFQTIKQTLNVIRTDTYYNDVDELVITYYGGEPLLSYELIKESVEYIRKMMAEYRITFSISTNGSLLNEEIIDFLHRNDFYTYISIDGNEDIHNENRLYIDKSPTFNDVMNNIILIKEKFSEYYSKRIGYNITINSKTDINKVMDFFFSKKELFPTNKLNFSSVLEMPFESNHGNKGLSSLLLRAFNRMIDSDGDCYSTLEKDQYINEVGRTNLLFQLGRLHKRLFINRISRRYIHPSGCCIPGHQLLYVESNGDFSFCQSVVGKNNCIGNAKHGINKDAIKKIITLFQDIMLDKCKKCWVVNLCWQCYFSLKLDMGNNSQIESICESYRTEIYNDLILYTEIIAKHKYFFKYPINILHQEE